MSTTYPAFFIGHGSPMNAIDETRFAQNWRELGHSLPRPDAIVCISAHWETMGTRVTAMPQPRTIHDFYGFPKELFAVNYPAPGNQELAEEIQSLLGASEVSLDTEWGLDHGCWSILVHLFPDAEVPVVQLSLDRRISAKEHYKLAKRLRPLRDRNIMLFASGNIVHNLQRIELPEDAKRFDFNHPFALPWATEANEKVKKLIRERNHDSLIDFHRLGASMILAAPTDEHFLPLLYILAQQDDGEQVTFFNDEVVAGSLSMTSVRLG